MIQEYFKKGLVQHDDDKYPLNEYDATYGKLYHRSFSASSMDISTFQIDMLSHGYALN